MKAISILFVMICAGVQLLAQSDVVPATSTQTTVTTAATVSTQTSTANSTTNGAVPAVAAAASPSYSYLYFRLGRGFSDMMGYENHHHYDFEDFHEYGTVAQPRVSTHFGMGISLPLWSWFAVRTEINYSQKGVDEYRGLQHSTGLTVQHKLATDYVEVPVLLSLNVPASGMVRGSFYLGGYSALMLKGTHSQAIINPTSGEVQQQLPDETASQMQRFDVGAVAGVSLGFRLMGMTMFADARLTHGILPLFDDYHEHVNRKAELSLGVALGSD